MSDFVFASSRTKRRRLEAKADNYLLRFEGSASKSNVSIDKYKSNESESIALKSLTLSTASNSCPLIVQAASSQSKPKEHDCLDLEYDDFLGENNENKDDKAYIHITESLSKWAVRFNTSHVALCALLIVLKADKLDVALNARTLLTTPKKVKLSQLLVVSIIIMVYLICCA